MILGVFVGPILCPALHCGKTAVVPAAGLPAVPNTSLSLASSFFSLFPALILLTSVFGLLAGPGTKLHEMLLQYIATALPASAFEAVQKVLTETNQAAGGGKITFGVLVTLWSASAAMTAVPPA